MDKVNIGESTLKDFGNVINEAADILNKGKVAFDNSIPDKTLQVLPYTGQAGAITPSKIGDLNNLTTTAKDNLVNAINEVNGSTIKFLDNTLNWTVGPSGHFTSLSEALREACKYRPMIQMGSSFRITITIETGYDFYTDGYFDMMDVCNVNLGFVSIQFESRIVYPSRSTWLRFYNSVAPTIILDIESNADISSVLNYINSTGTLEIKGIYCKGISAEKGSNVIINKGDIDCSDLDGAPFTNAFIEANTGSNIRIRGDVSLSGSKNKGSIIKLSDGSHLSSDGAINVQLSDSACLLEADMCSHFDISYMVVSSTSDAPVFVVSNGSYGTYVGTKVGTAAEANIPFNQVTASGIIFKN